MSRKELFNWKKKLRLCQGTKLTRITSSMLQYNIIKKKKYSQQENQIETKVLPFMDYIS